MPGVTSLKKILPIRDLSPAADAVEVFKYSVGVLKGYKRELCALSLIKGIVFPLGIATVYVTKLTLDRGIFARDLNAFIYFTFLGLAMYMVSRILWYAANTIILKIRSGFSVEMNRDLTGRLFGLDYLKLKEISSAESSYFLGYDQQVAESLVLDELPSLISLVKVPILLVMMAVMSLPLALMALISVPLTALHVFWASGKRKRYRAKANYFSRKHTSVLHDILMNMKIVKSFVKEEWALSRVMSLFKKKTYRGREAAQFIYKSRFISDISAKVCTVMFCLLGGYLIIGRGLSFGSFSAVTIYAAMMIHEIDNLGDVLQRMGEERSSIRRNARFIREITPGTRPTGTVSLPKNPVFPEGDVVFEGVTFGYEEGRKLFRGLSFRIPRGSWVLIRGESGAGKTTLMSLMLRLIPDYSGTITVGGEEIEQIDAKVFSESISVVHQEPYLFNDSMVNNIFLGDDPDPGSLADIMRCSCLDELVRGIPSGYNSRMGEAGLSLSGGQRQRIAIARALARRPGILILDEATASIDTETEKRIFDNIRERYPGITVVLITHRPGSEEFADEIYRLEKGQMLEEGGTNVNTGEVRHGR